MGVTDKHKHSHMYWRMALLYSIAGCTQDMGCSCVSQQSGPSWVHWFNSWHGAVARWVEINELCEGETANVPFPSSVASHKRDTRRTESSNIWRISRQRARSIYHNITMKQNVFRRQIIRWASISPMLYANVLACVVFGIKELFALSKVR